MSRRASSASAVAGRATLGRCHDDGGGLLGSGWFWVAHGVPGRRPRRAPRAAGSGHAGQQHGLARGEHLLIAGDVPRREDAVAVSPAMTSARMWLPRIPRSRWTARRPAWPRRRARGPRRLCPSTRASAGVRGTRSPRGSRGRSAARPRRRGPGCSWAKGTSPKRSMAARTPCWRTLATRRPPDHQQQRPWRLRQQAVQPQRQRAPQRHTAQDVRQHIPLVELRMRVGHQRVQQRPAPGVIHGSCGELWQRDVGARSEAWVVQRLHVPGVPQAVFEGC